MGVGLCENGGMRLGDRLSTRGRAGFTRWGGFDGSAVISTVLAARTGRWIMT